MGDGNGIISLGAVTGLFQALGIFFAVAKFQRVGGRIRQFDLLIAVLVEKKAQSSVYIEAKMVVAVGAYMQVLIQFAVKDHLSAAGTLVPHVVGYFLLADNGTDLGTDEIGKPAHTRAPRTPADISETKDRTSFTSPGRGLP